MAIKRRILECDCGERFDEEREDGTITGDLSYGTWKFKQHSVKEGVEAGSDLVNVYFVRSVDCNKCMTELFREKKCYVVVASSKKPAPFPPAPHSSTQPVLSPQTDEK